METITEFLRDPPTWVFVVVEIVTGSLLGLYLGGGFARGARGKGREAQTRAATIRFQAERKAGEFLGEMGVSAGNYSKSEQFAPRLSEQRSLTLGEQALTRTHQRVSYVAS